MVSECMSRFHLLKLRDKCAEPSHQLILILNPEEQMELPSRCMGIQLSPFDLLFDACAYPSEYILSIRNGMTHTK